jgi:5-methylcytosine-specific restriction protein A
MPTKPKSHAQRMAEANGGGRRARDGEYRDRRAVDPIQVQVDRLRACRRWRAVRRMKLARDPLCETCEAHGLTVLATDVNHTPSLRAIVLRGTYEDAYRLEALQSLCRSCHNRVTAGERHAMIDTMDSRE